MLIGHSRKDDNRVFIYQSLKEHSYNVAGLCKRSCEYIGASITGYLMGMLHDMGKADEEQVQPRLRGESQKKVNHASAGARYIWEKYGKSSDRYVRLTAKLVALSIVCHHSGRCDIYSLDGKEEWLERVMSKQAEPYYDKVKSNFFSECIKECEIEVLMKDACKEIQLLWEKISKIAIYRNKDSKFAKSKVAGAFMMGLLHRVLFGALVDADWTDTACFMDKKPLPTMVSEEKKKITWNKLSKEIENFLLGLQPKYSIDYLRNEISEQCLQAVKDKPGIYRLFVPTGGGKTYSGLRFAVHTAQVQNADRIFYFAPYKSILGQNAEDFRKALGNKKYVLEHHSDAIIEREGEGSENLIIERERWQEVPVIATTMVQFLNTLFASPRQNVRRLPALSHSILIFDEIQSLPLEDTYLFSLAINFLAGILKCTIVLCTATQPALEKTKYPINFSNDKDIVENYDEKFQQFKRTQVVKKDMPGGFSKEELARFIEETTKENNSILVVLNTKKAVEKIYDLLVDMLPVEVWLFCLTTNLCTIHRKEVIDEIKLFQKDKKYEDKKKLICISTQLIEAGVDLSFDCVIRSMAGLTSVAQAAGRCNRHGENDCKNVYLIRCDTVLEDLRYLPSIEKAQAATLSLLQEMPNVERDLLSPFAIEKYYERYYSNEKEMEYPLRINGKTGYTFLDLLSTNGNGVNVFKETYSKNIDGWMLNQAFSTAENSFEAIPNETISVLVPYGEQGRALITELISGNNRCVPYELIRKSQPYTVSIGRNQCKYLEKQDGIKPYYDGHLLILQDGFYDDSKGVQIKGEEGDIIFV